jgi:hypothetical protein
LAEFDINKLSTADKVIGGGAIVFLISMFLPWYGISVGNQSVDNKGTTYFLTGWLPLLLILLVVARVAITRFAPETKLPELPVPWSQATLGAAGAAAVLVLLRVLIKSSKLGGFSISIDLDRKYGLFIALLAAIAVAAGAFMKYQGKEDEAGAAPSGPPTAF